MRDEHIRTNEEENLHPQNHLDIPILVVEDDVDLRRITRGILKDAGYEVESAEDGEIAWQMIQRNDYALIITDNNMPKITGLDLLRLLHSARIVTPVILMTGQLPSEELTRNPQLQIEAIIPKPYTETALLSVVNNVLQGLAIGEIAEIMNHKLVNHHIKP